MIKQFNFYDVYGYLLPGILLMFVFWLPSGILTRSWPEQDISKALFLAVLAYIAGQVLQSIATLVVPSSTKSGRFPHDVVLDASDKTFSSAFKGKLAQQIMNVFELPVGSNADAANNTETSRNRQVAFFQARSYLIANKAAQYVEQFEGLYGMMRGLSCALLFGAAYLLGWCISFERQYTCLNSSMLIGLVVCLAVSVFSSGLVVIGWKIKQSALALALALLLASTTCGFWIAEGQSLDDWTRNLSHPQGTLWIVFFLLLIAASRCYSAYKAFADRFAQSVWRDFSAHIAFKSTPSNPKKGGEQDDEEDDE